MWPFSKTETKASKVGGVGMTLVQKLAPASWSRRNYASYAKEAYQINVIANSAINRITNAVTTIKIRARLPSGEEVDSHPILDLLDRPNAMQSSADWWATRLGFLLLSGNGYDEAVIERNKVLELWPLRPDRVSIKTSSTGMPGAYIYEHNGAKHVFPADPVTGKSPIHHFKLFNPLDDVYGMSPVSAAAYAVDQHNESMSWVQALLQNSARPSGALVLDKETALSQEEFDRVKKEIEENHTGPQNAGRPMLLEGGLDWKQMGLSPVDMEILKAREMAARDISLAFGVPPLLLNIPGDNTYANYREARLGFYEDTIIPFMNNQLSDLSHFLGPYFGGVKLIIDHDSIEAIIEKRMKNWAMADASDELTINEVRKIKGFPPLPTPVGDMLMAELRKGSSSDSPVPDPTKSHFSHLERLGYGNR